MVVAPMTLSLTQSITEASNVEDTADMSKHKLKRHYNAYHK